MSRKITKSTQDLKPGDIIIERPYLINFVISNEDVGDDCLCKLVTLDQNNCISITENGRYSYWIVLIP